MDGCTRRRFLGTVSASIVGAALLPSCEMAGPGVVLPDLGADSGLGIVTVPFAGNQALLTVGGGVVLPEAQLAVVRTSLDSAVALNGICTHAACPLTYPQGSLILECNCHGAQFSLNGGVIKGPAKLPLALFPATVGPDAIIVTRG